jgi:hypothetical protein
MKEVKSRRKPLHGEMWGLIVSADGGGCGAAAAAAGDVDDREDLWVEPRSRGRIVDFGSLDGGQMWVGSIGAAR